MTEGAAGEAAEVARRKTKAVAEQAAEMRRGAEAPGKGDVGDGARSLHGIADLVARLLQTAVPDQAVQRLVLALEQFMQVALGTAAGLGDGVEAEPGIAQIGGDDLRHLALQRMAQA